MASTFGRPKGAYKPATAEFQRSHTGKMGSNELPQPKRFSYDDSRRPPIPSRDQPPIYGLHTNKNFVVLNAVENILAAPKVIKKETPATEKADYGCVPKYLQRIKDQINEEYESIRAMHQKEEEEEEQKRYELSSEEVEKLREGLQKKWEAVNQEYQKITHISKVDTQELRRR
eukprot:TRINITY_DN3301_c0_g1_i9.p1 TRINITY_DN3301_c0_g1~~TRINITY_DN3301_c0_g1_i9.p1  ORF type:complete len:173 (-),score=48.90 TRINITY_DN3301_c0_g1_i9:195-713(-)